MKFTEEQFNTLVKVQEDQYPDNLFSTPKDDDCSIGYTVAQTDIDLNWFIFRYDLGNEAVALMNPVTREWAHEQFVEKEKRYVWTSKKMSSDGTRLRLQNTGTNGVVRAYGKYKDRKADCTEHLTESEIKAWGYDPEWFNKEEVE